jgi:hypothetical protein
MSNPAVTRSRRQSAYLDRSKSARILGKLLIPVLMLAISASAWTDPVMKEKLDRGLAEVTPMVEAVMDGEPVQQVLASKFGGPQAGAAPESDDVEVANATVPGLPHSAVPVNRPQARPAVTN